MSEEQIAQGEREFHGILRKETDDCFFEYLEAPGASATAVSRSFLISASRPELTRPLRIVSLDDELGVLKALEIVLSNIVPNSIVLTFNSPESALKELERQDPDLFTTDWNHPGRLHGDGIVHVLAKRKVKRILDELGAGRHLEDGVLAGVLVEEVEAQLVRPPVLVRGGAGAVGMARERALAGFAHGIIPFRGVEYLSRSSLGAEERRRRTTAFTARRMRKKLSPG